MTTITVEKSTRWWQFWRRLKEWRSLRRYVGREIIMNGKRGKIVEYGKHTVTVDKWRDAP